MQIRNSPSKSFDEMKKMKPLNPNPIQLITHLHIAPKDKDSSVKINNGTKIPKTRSLRKITKQSKEQHEKTTNDISKNNMEAGVNLFNKPKDRQAGLEVHSDCTKQNRLLELDSAKHHRQNSSDNI